MGAVGLGGYWISQAMSGGQSRFQGKPMRQAPEKAPGTPEDHVAAVNELVAQGIRLKEAVGTETIRAREEQRDVAEGRSTLAAVSSSAITRHST